jgi:hypothetical protein
MMVSRKIDEDVAILQLAYMYLCSMGLSVHTY